jgi:ssDNA-binding Zn-finger/Zn-ribbon topoisomerase 1
VKDLHSKISYLQGLAEGLNLDTTSKEGRILSNILDILDDMAAGIKELQDAQLELEDYVESIDEDLNALEDDFYDEFDDEDSDYENDDIEYMEVECPNCHDIVYFETDLLDNEDEIFEISCPNCDEVVFKTDYDIEESEQD